MSGKNSGQRDVHDFHSSKSWGRTLRFGLSFHRFPPQWRTENRQLSQFLFQLPNPLLQELPLRFLLGQRQRLFVRSAGLGGPAEPAVHICAG